MEEGDLLPGMETCDKPGEVQRPAWWRSLPRCCSCPLHCPPHNLAHTAQAPAELYLLPRSRSHRAKFHQLSTSAERGLFCMCAILSTGWSSCQLPLFRGPLAHSCSPFLTGVFPGPAISTNPTVTVLNISALTPFQRRIWSPRPSGHECERRAHLSCFQEPFEFRWECHAIQKGICPHRAGFELALH